MRRVVPTVLFALLAARPAASLSPTRVRSDEAADAKVTPAAAVAPEAPVPSAAPAPLQTYTLRFRVPPKGSPRYYAVRQQNELEVEYNEVAEKTKSQANSVRHFKSPGRRQRRGSPRSSCASTAAT